MVKQRFQLGKAGLHRLRSLGNRAFERRCPGRRSFDLPAVVAAGRISARGGGRTAGPRRGGEVAACQVSQDVAVGVEPAVAGLEVNGAGGEQQEEVEGGGDEGQGQADCPGAAAKAPPHPAERRGDRTELLRQDLKI